MQVGLLNKIGTRGDATSLERSAPVPQAAATAPALQPGGPASRASRLRPGLANWNLAVQGQVAGAQQALDYLERSAGQLQQLKADLSAKLAARASGGAQLDARLRQFSRTWSQRSDASGGTLDSRLGFAPDGMALQRFTIAGLSLARLQSGDRETLAMQLGGSGQPLRSVTIEPGLTDAAIAARFDQALAPAGVRAGIEQGALVFSTAESNFAQVANALAIKGAGIRFPTGQLNRVKAQAEPALIDPQQWHNGDADALRQTLLQVTTALERIQRSRESVQRALAAASRQVDSAHPAAEAAEMERVVDNFSAIAKGNGYESLIIINAALFGMSRERVIALLGLG